MGLAVDTIGGFITNSAAGAAVTLSPGDSATVRAFNAPAAARLDGITRKGATSGFGRVRSPLFADNTQGIRFQTGEAPSVFELPPGLGENLNSQDTMTIEANSGAADSTILGLHVYYENLGGGAARLYSPGDIQGNVAHIKPVEVDCTSSATIGTWVDTVVTTTEDLMHANTDYAVLGFLSNVSCGLIGIKGQETANLRITGPGTTLNEDTADYWWKLSARHGCPYIPVFNAANKASVFVSVLDNAASTAVKVTLILAQLANILPNPS